MPTIEKKVRVTRPVRTTYNQWTQFEEFPEFMEGVEQVTQVDDRHLHWVASIGGVRREWDAEIVDQTPDQRVAWRSTGETRNEGVVTFHPVGPEETEVGLALTFEPDGALEKAGDKLGLVERRIEGDLERFKQFLESREVETGAWRGQI